MVISVSVPPVITNSVVMIVPEIVVSPSTPREGVKIMHRFSFELEMVIGADERMRQRSRRDHSIVTTPVVAIVRAIPSQWSMLSEPLI